MSETKLHRVIFTCGGTAGHVNPAIALAQLMQRENPKTEVLFVGAERGLEKDLVPKAGYPFRTVHISVPSVPRRSGTTWSPWEI